MFCLSLHAKTVMGLLIICLFAMGCPSPSTQTVTEVKETLQSLADNSVPVEQTANTIVNKLTDIYQQEGAAKVEEYYRHAMEDFVAEGGSLAELAARSSQIAPHMIELNPNKAKDDGKALNRVLYVNGINTDYAGFVSDFLALNKVIAPFASQYGITCAGVWNPTSGFFKDVAFECVPQAFLDWVYGTMASSNTSSFTQELDKVLNENYAHAINVIIVPHSQGNFYTSAALARMEAAKQLRTNVIQVGSPEGEWPSALRNNFRIDVAGDIVPLLANVEISPLDFVSGGMGLGSMLVSLLNDVVSLTTPQRVLVPGTSDSTFGTLEYFLDHHDFQTSYLTGNAQIALTDSVKKFCIASADEITSVSDFVGVWTCTDPERTYDEYHLFIEFYTDGIFDCVEFREGTFFTGDGVWNYANGEFSFASTAGAFFSGTVSGSTNNFYLTGFWTNGTDGILDFVRRGKTLKIPTDVVPSDTSDGKAARRSEREHPLQWNRIN